MARRTRQEALATHEQLLDAAERVFRVRGVGHTSLAEIADAAGVTRGAVYHHFASKAELFLAMVARAGMPLDAALDDLKRSGVNDPLGAVRTLALHALHQLATSARTQAVFDVVFLRCEYTDEFASVQARRRRETRQCKQQCEETFRLAVAAGQLPPDTDTALAARGLYAYVGGLMRDWVENPRGYDLAGSARALIDVYLEGLRRQPPRRDGRGPAATGGARVPGRRRAVRAAKSRSAAGNRAT